MNRMLTQGNCFNDETDDEAQPRSRLQLAELTLYASEGLSAMWWFDARSPYGERIYWNHKWHTITRLWSILP